MGGLMWVCMTEPRDSGIGRVTIYDMGLGSFWCKE